MDLVSLIQYRHSKKYNDFVKDSKIKKKINWNYDTDLLLLKYIKDKLIIQDISENINTSVKDIQKRLKYLIEIIGMETNLDYTNSLLSLKDNPIKEDNSIKKDNPIKKDNSIKEDNPIKEDDSIKEDDYIILTNDHLLSGRSEKGGYKAEQLRLLGIIWPPIKGWKDNIIGKLFPKETIDKFINFYQDTNPKIYQYFGIIEKKQPQSIQPDYYVYTDGACKNNGYDNSITGYGIYFGENDPRNISQILEGRQTNNTAELIALIKVYDYIKEDLERGLQVGIVSDSIYAIGCCTHYGEKCSKTNWGSKKKQVIPNIELVKTAYSIYKSLNNIKFIHIKAHTNNTDKHSLGNNEADRLANLAIGLNECPYLSRTKIYFRVPFDQKEVIKKYGGKWDSEKKKWYIYNNNSNLSIVYNIFPPLNKSPPEKLDNFLP